jgi:HEAT repeat protein
MKPKNLVIAGLTSAILAFPFSASATSPSVSALKNDLLSRKAPSFDALLKTWEIRYSSEAVAPLLKIAADRKLADADRYVALMGAARLGGKEGAPLLVPYLKDSSWMIRSGALRALSALGNHATAKSVLPLLNDPALVIRSQAIQAVQALKPEGSIEALVSVLERGANYHAGKADGVPQKALVALAALSTAEDAKRVAPRLKPLLGHSHDPALKKLAYETIATLAKRQKQ